MSKTPEALIDSIKDKLDRFQIKLDNRKGDFDYYILAETLLIPVLNNLFDCNLLNPNKTKMNFAGIDLADAEKRICFQVTKQTGLNKVKETLEKTIKHHNGLYDELYIICLSPKQQSYSQEAINAIIDGYDLQFDAARHILDISDIAAGIKYLADSPHKLNTIDKHLTYTLAGRDDNSPLSENLKILEHFIQSRYIDSQYIKSSFAPHLIQKYSELFSYVSTLEGRIEPQASPTDNLFDICLKHILETDSDNPLIVTGLPGSGKSTFLSLFYKYASQKLIPEIDAATPVYINLQYYFGETSSEQALKKMQSDVNRINEYLPDAGKEMILILDGNDDSFRYSIDTANQLIAIILREFSIKKKIIGMNISDKVFYIEKPDSSLYNFASDAESRLTLQNISIYNKNYDRIIALYAELNQSQSGNESPIQLEKYLIEKIAQYKILRIDFFMLYLFCKKRHNYQYKDCKTLSDFYRQFCFEKLSNITDSRLLSASNMAFDFFIKKEQIEQVDFKGWELIHTHLSIRDYLLAFQIIYRLKTIGSNDKRFTKQDYECFNFVYTDSINNFCKEIMNTDQQTQKYVADGIYKIFSKVELTAQTHFCYLLGRFNSQNQKEFALQFLNLLLEKIDKSGNKQSNNNQSIEKQYLLYYRTIFISLIYLGDKKANNAYIQKLLDDAKWNSINRGFHREYYGDIPFDPGLKSLTLEDNVEEDFSNTFTKLYRKLSDSLNEVHKYSLFEIELFTLCSLAQHRQVHKNGKITADQITTINNLLQRVLDLNRIDMDKPIGKYVEFLIDNLTEERFVPLGKIFAKVYNIKAEDRAGWRKRGLRNTEKVSSHMYGAFLIGKICLPDSLPDNPTYDKNKILDMILIHDLGEAQIGDKTPDEKKEQDRKDERRTIESISLLGTYFENRLADIGINYHDFESKTGNNINVVIANDLDKLDNLMQLQTYVLKQNLFIPDYNDWVNALIKSIKSDQGKKIMHMMLEYFETFAED